MKRLIIAAVTLALVVGVVTGGIVGNPFASAEPGAPNPGHLWIELEGHGTSGDPVDTYYLGTTSDAALELHVNDDRALRLEPDVNSPNIIGGYGGNWVTSNVVGATIGGGGVGDDGTGSPAPNRVTDDVGTVGGGANNQAGDGVGGTGSAYLATVGGGWNNAASGQWSTVGGGFSNLASGPNATISGGQSNQASESNAAVSGGQQNNASAAHATVGGGYNNNAGGNYATVPGGFINSAAGEYSFAAGKKARANNAGCFIWGDSGIDPQYVDCDANNQFKVYSSGGIYLYTSRDGSTGQYLAGGSSSWSTPSSRDVKENFAELDGQEVLVSLAEVPINTWNYKAQDNGIRHAGAVAEDFYAAFGLGESDTAISSVDADGVALAAIQGLYELSQEQGVRIQALETENTALQQRLDSLEARMTALEEGTGGSALVSQASSSGLPAGWLVVAGLLGGLVLGGLVLAQRRLTGARR